MVIRMWRDLMNRLRAGFAHDPALTISPTPGSLALYCPSCPQPGVNLPENWHEDKDSQWKYRRVLTMDGNFKADHLAMKLPDEVFLSDGLQYFVGKPEYQQHLKAASDKIQVLHSMSSLLKLFFTFPSAEIPVQQPQGCQSSQCN